MSDFGMQAGRLNTIIIGPSVQGKSMTARLLRAAEGRVFVNGQEVFRMSRRKAKKLAYRWRGSRRGRRIAAWLNRTETHAGWDIEEPAEIRMRSKRK